MIETLWCVEILGQDDIIATESREVAQAMADGFNTWWRGREDRHPDEPYREADVIEWPYDAASHQRELAGCESTTAGLCKQETTPQLLPELLPKGAREMTAKDLATVEKWFGARGKFPAVHIPTGEIGV